MTQQDQAAQRVTTERIYGLVATLTYETARVPNTTSTIATARLPSGFVVGIGHSACVSPANFDAELGRKYAIEDAGKKALDALWQFEGYLLAHELAKRAAFDAEPKTSDNQQTNQRPALGAAHPRYSTLPSHQQRVIDEKCALDERKQKLEAFLDTPTFAQLENDEQGRMHAQLAAMTSYARILGERIEGFAPAHHPV